MHTRMGAARHETLAVYLACRDPRVPWFAKLVGGIVLAYALSPVDLIPDFIPVLGYVDDALLLPGLIWLAIRLLPAGVVASSRVEADRWMVEQGERPRSYAGATLIVAVWVLAGYGAWAWWNDLNVSQNICMSIYLSILYLVLRCSFQLLWTLDSLLFL